MDLNYKGVKMFTLLMTFIKGNATRIIIGLVMTAVLSGGGWFIKNKYDNMQIERDQQIEVIAILTNEYEEAIHLAESNAEAFHEYREMIKVLDRKMHDKHQEDIKREKGIADIRERVYNVDKKDDNVSAVIRSTLDGIRLLRESKGD